MNTLPHRERARRALRRLRGAGGYSLAELLTAVLLLSILSIGVASGVSFAGRQYKRTMIVAERKVLCSTLTEIVSGELRNTPEIRLTAGGRMDSFYSRGFAHVDTDMSRFYSVRVDEKLNYTDAGEGAFGQLMLGNEDENGDLVGNLLLSGAAYTKYDLQARVEVDYSRTEEMFHVTLEIRSPDGEIMTSQFDVIPLNDLQITEA